MFFNLTMFISFQIFFFPPLFRPSRPGICLQKFKFPKNIVFGLVPEHALGPSSQVIPGYRVRHPCYSKKHFVRTSSCRVARTTVSSPSTYRFCSINLPPGTGGASREWSQTKTLYWFYRTSVPAGPWGPRKIFLSSKILNSQSQQI